MPANVSLSAMLIPIAAAAQNMAAGQGTLADDPLTPGPATDSTDPAAVQDVVVQQVPLTPLQALMEEAFGRYFMMLAWCALYLALVTGEKARAAERTAS